MSTVMTRANLCLLFLAILLGGTRLAEASLITWEFAGVINTVFDPENQLDGVIVQGSPFSVSFTYESTTPDRFPNALDHGSYTEAIKAVNGQVGEIGISNPQGVFGKFSVLNNPAAGTAVFDLLGLNIAIDETASPVDFLTMSLGATDLSGTMFADDSLPLFPPDLDILDSTSFILQTQVPNVWVRGELTSLTPEPASLVLFALTGMLACRR